MTEEINNTELDEPNQGLSELLFSMILKHNIDLAERVISIDGDISDKIATKFDKQMRVLECTPEPITIYINTDGGDMITHFSIIDRIRLSRCHTTVIATGIVASAGLSILAAGTVRKATKYCNFMHHNLSSSRPMSKVHEHEVNLKFDKHLDKKRFQFLTERTLKPYSWWAAVGKHTDFFFDADTAKEIGLIHEVL